MSTRKAEAKAMVNNFQALVERIRDSETYDKEVVRDEISEQINQLMKRENVSKAELARRLEKSRAYVTKILQGNANFTLDTLVQIARALGYRYTLLFVPKEAEWRAAGEIHLSARAARPASAVMSEEDFIPVQVNVEGSENDKGGKRTAG